MNPNAYKRINFQTNNSGAIKMKTKMKMIYWESGNFFLGKLIEHPDIMTQGETLEELEDNIKDAYLLLVLDDVPDEYHIKEITF